MQSCIRSGVLTKPDRLTAGDIGKQEQLRALFDGEASSHSLQKGYYCVRLPNDRERQSGLTRAQVQEKERGFFRTTAPWKDLKSARRLGVPNLVRDISHLLMGVTQSAYVSASLPNPPLYFYANDLDTPRAPGSPQCAQL